MRLRSWVQNPLKNTTGEINPPTHPQITLVIHDDVLKIITINSFSSNSVYSCLIY
jgi:hypothetical protein